MQNRRGRKLLKSSRKKNNERLTWNFLGWIVWAKNERIEWCTSCDERRNKIFPPGWLKHFRGKRRPKIIWKERCYVTEKSLNIQGDCVSERGRKRDKTWKDWTRHLFWPRGGGGGVLLKIWLQNIAVLTVNYYVVRSTDKTKHSTYVSLLLFCIVFGKYFCLKLSLALFLQAKIYLLLKCNTKCVVMTYSYMWNTT